MFYIARPSHDLDRTQRIAAPRATAGDCGTDSTRGLRQGGASRIRADCRVLTVRIEARQVWGVPVPRLSALPLARAADARGASPGSWGPSAAAAAGAHEMALDLLLAIASRELHLGRLGDEIRTTSRRIHAIEEIVAPRLAAEAHQIALAL